MGNITFSPFIEAIEKNNINMEGIIVWQKGEELGRHMFIPEKRRNQFSASKSFTSCAVGMALEEGLFTLDDKVLKYFEEDAPENPNENLQALTIRDLLTMAPGQGEAQLMGNDRPEIRKITDNYAKFALSKPFEYKPGTHFKYNNLGPYLAGLIIQKLTKQNLVDYLMPRLFDPLEIPRPTWETDPKGNTFGAGGLEITVSELHKFIQMYYNYGEFNGKRILSKEWVEESTSFKVDNAAAHPEAIDNQQGYCYLFWRGQHNSFRADGKYAKYAIVLRDIDAIITLNAHDPKQQLVLDVVWDTIYPQLV